MVPDFVEPNLPNILGVCTNDRLMDSSVNDIIADGISFS